MSVATQILIYCDGGGGCPGGSAEACEGDRQPGLNTTLRHYRTFLRGRGWVLFKGKDYCPECWIRLRGQLT